MPLPPIFCSHSSLNTLPQKGIRLSWREELTLYSHLWSIATCCNIMMKMKRTSVLFGIACENCQSESGQKSSATLSPTCSHIEVKAYGATMAALLSCTSSACLLACVAQDKVIKLPLRSHAALA